MKKKRNIGIELLRIMSMYFIAVLHILNVGGILNAQDYHTPYYWVLRGMYVITFCSVNVFALISGYVGWNRNLGYNKLLQFWTQVFFYTLGITIVTKVLYPELVTRGRWVYCLIPITSHQYWYATAYFGLMIFMPLLNCGISQLERKRFTELVILFGLFIVLFTTIWPQDSYEIRWGFSVVWLMMLYILGGYLSKYSVLGKIGGVCGGGFSAFAWFYRWGLVP